MAGKGKKLVALATGAGVFVDSQTGFKVVGSNVVELDLTTAGEQTLNALKHNGLVESDEPAETKKSTSDALPKDLPSRDVLVKANIKTVSQLNETKKPELLKIAGIDEAALKAIDESLTAENK